MRGILVNMRRRGCSKAGTLLATLVLAASWMGVSSPAEGSCQTSFCYYQRDQLGRQREADLKEKISEDPSNPHDWQGLLSLLEDKYRREKSLAAFHARLHWEPQPVLEAPEAYRAQYEAETAEWRAAYREAFPESRGHVCQRARHVEDPVERVQWLQSELEEALDPLAVSRCLTQALVEADRTGEAVDLLVSLRDEFPEDPRTHGELTSLLSRLEAEDSLLRALEMQAAQFPDDLDSQEALLSAYDQQGRYDNREALFEGLWQRFPSIEERRSLCWAVGSVGGRQVECFLRLLDESTPDNPTHEEILDSARFAVWIAHYHHDNWAALQRMSSTFLSTGKLLSSWSSIASDREEHARNCAEFRKFFDAGGFERLLKESWDAPSEVRSLAGLLVVCNRKDDGEKLLRSWLSDQPDAMLRWPRGYPEIYRLEIERRLAKDPGNRELLQGLLRTDPSPQDRLEIRGRLAALPPDDPRDVKPLLTLAHELRRQGRLKEAARVMAQAVERRPEDADLLIQTGLAALEAKDHERVRSLARRVLRQKDASVRQRAEAGYLLGRVDFRQGRLDEAIQRFDRYFSLRLRFGGCPDWITCDLAFQLLLTHVGNVDRLRDYQERRAEGIEAFRDQIEDRFFPRKSPSYDMVVICSEVPCQRWTLAQIEEHFAGRDRPLLTLSQQLRQTDW